MNQMMPNPTARLIRLTCLIVLSLFLITAKRLIAQESDEFRVMIARPAEGETYYYGPSSLLYNISITGAVIHRSQPVTEVELTLEVFHNGELVGNQIVWPATDGTYIFFATVNPQGEPGQHADDRRYMGLTDTCGGSCHDYRLTDFHLVPGHLLLQVTARDGRSETVTATRHIIVDQSGLCDVPVRVVHEDEPDVAIGGVPVTASTWLYMWRSRYSGKASTADAYTTMQIESLAEAPTHYVFRVNPVIVDGILFEGIEPVELILPPGAVDAPPLTLKVRSSQGAIYGQMSAPAGQPSLPLSLSAVSLSSGRVYHTEVGEAAIFTFDNLPIERYLVIFEQEQLEALGMAGEYLLVDLSQSPVTTIEMAVTASAGNNLRGVIQDEVGNPLPFAWVSLERDSKRQQVAPESGTFSLTGLADESQTILMHAPGYYSQAQVISPPFKTDSPYVFTLEKQTATQDLEWGNGHLTIPVETEVTINENQLELTYGWLWGSGGNSHMALRIGNAVIILHQARFALTRPPGSGESWFYLFSGAAAVINTNQPEPVQMRADQMVQLSDGYERFVPLPIEPMVIEAIQSTPQSSLPVWQPGLGEQLRNQLALLGIRSAKVITFITYLLVLLSLLAVPLYLLFSKGRQRLWKKVKRL